MSTDAPTTAHQIDILNGIATGTRGFTGDAEEDILRGHGLLTGYPVRLTSTGWAALAAWIPQTPPAWKGRYARLLTVACPYCDKPAGEQCRTQKGAPASHPHDGRYYAYRTANPQTPPAVDSHASSRTHHEPVEGDPGRSVPTSSPAGLPTTTHQVDRLRTLLAWCVDYAHALPDGWSASVYRTGTNELAWFVPFGAGEVAARLREQFGPPDDIIPHDDEPCAHWWDEHDGQPRLVVHYVTPDGAA